MNFDCRLEVGREQAAASVHGDSIYFSGGTRNHGEKMLVT